MLTRLHTRWDALPRDGRDTLFLLTVIAAVVLLQLPHLPLWCVGLALALLLWRGWLTVSLRPLPGLWPRLGLLLLALAATYLSHRSIVGRDAGVTLIVVLLALKTLELRARRDAFVVFFLSFFTLLTHFFYSQSLLTALGIVLALWGLLTALVNAHLPVGRPPLWRSARLAGGMALLGAPIMVVLFMLFPRMAPLWGIPSDGLNGRSGLSPTVKVGTIASLALDDSVVMRIRFDTPVLPPRAQMYFRGPVLGRFDGREWTPLVSGFSGRGDLRGAVQVSGEPLRYRVTLEPTNRPWLLVLDATTEAPTWPGAQDNPARVTPDLQWLLRRPVTDLMRYDVVSHPNFRHGPTTQVLGLQDHLELPPGFNPRTLAMAQSMRNEHPNASPADLVQIALDRLRQGGYTYTLDPGLYGEHTADEFWFDRKAGFCEHIASAYVVLMRALDIPARLVTGYQGGDVNPVDGYFTVRQSDAHAWTEVWLAGQGWVRVDPTSAVAPGRTGTFQRLRPDPGFVGGALRTIDPALADRLRALWEATNNHWNQWVLNYTQSRQLELLRDWGLQAEDWTDLLRALAIVLVAATLAGALWVWRGRRRRDPWLALLERAHRRLQRAGAQLAPHATPRMMARQLPAHWPHADRLAWQDWLQQMEQQRYQPGAATSDSGARALLATLRQDFHRLPWSAAAPAISTDPSPPAPLATATCPTPPR